MISSIISVLALSAVGIAAPAPVPQVAPEAISSASSFSIDAIKTNTVRNGTASILKAYAKYNIKPTKPMPAISDAIAKRQNGVVTATDSNNVEYICPVSIGGQTLNLDFDTGSADLSVFMSLSIHAFH